MTKQPHPGTNCPYLARNHEEERLKIASQSTSPGLFVETQSGQKYVLTRSFILRTTGFPVELIDSLSCHRLAEITDAGLAARQQYVAQIQALLSSATSISRKVRRSLKRCLLRDGNLPAGIGQEFPELDRQLALMAELHARANDVYQQEFDRVRRLLYEITGGEDFQQVLLLSSPGLSSLTPKEPHLPAARNSHVRQREVSWISYLQRLTTKNETVSFFGPCAWGQFDLQEPAPVCIELSAPRISRRTVYIERWVCEALAGLMSEDPQVRPLLPLRLADGLVIRGRQAALLIGGRTLTFDLSEPECEFLKKCALSTQHSTDSQVAETLLKRRLLIREVQIPPIPLPFAALQDQVANWRDHRVRAKWQGILENIDKCADTIRQNWDLEGRRAAINAMKSTLAELGLGDRPVSRALYSSRLPITEDCELGTHKLVLGKPVIDKLLGDAVPWYDLWRDIAGLYATRLHEFMRESWQAMGQKPLPLPIFWPAIIKAWMRCSEVEEEIQQAWHNQLGERRHARVVSLSEEDAGFLRNNFQFRRMKAFDNMSLDLQIVANKEEGLSQGHWTLILAEIHPDFATWQHCFFVWCPDTESYSKDYDHQDNQATAAVIGRFPPYFGTAHTSLGIYPYAYRFAFVGVPGPAGVQTVRAAEALVSVTEDDVLVLNTDGRVLGSILHTWRTASNTHRLQLHGDANHSPRLQVGQLIVQREFWVLTPDAALIGAAKTGGYGAFAAFREFRARHGLPEQVFVRGFLPQRLTVDKDIKPVFVDFSNPLLLEMLGKMIGRFDKILVTEMLPKVEDCWLKGTAGHYSCEFRTVVLSSRDSRR